MADATFTLEVEQGRSFRSALWAIRGLVLCQYAAGIVGGLTGVLLAKLCGF